MAKTLRRGMYPREELKCVVENWVAHCKIECVLKRFVLLSDYRQGRREKKETLENGNMIGPIEWLKGKDFEMWSNNSMLGPWCTHNARVLACCQTKLGVESKIGAV